MIKSSQPFTPTWKLLGGIVEGVMFDDALERLEETEAALEASESA